MNRHMAMTVFGLAVFLAAQGAGAQWEARALARVDSGGTEESPLGGVAGLGYEVREGMTLGLYTSYVSTDRDLPTRMREMYGFGVYTEFDLSEGYALMPFVGASVGSLDCSGPGNPTVLHLVGSLGLKYFLNDSVGLSAAASLHWAGDAIFDYERQGPIGWTAERYDVTLDVGVRVRF